MTSPSIVALIVAVLGLIAPLVAGHIPTSTLQLIVSVASAVAIIAAHVVSALQPNVTQTHEARVAATAVVLREKLAAHAAKAACIGGALLCLSLAACTPSALATAQKDVATVDSYLPLACEVVETINPAIGSTVCTLLTLAGEATSATITIVGDVEQVKAFVAVHPSLASRKLARARAH